MFLCFWNIKNYGLTNCGSMSIVGVNPKNEIEIFNKWQKIKLSLVFAIDRQTYAKYDCENA